MTAKGGYVVGIGGTPDENLLIFDSVALTLRLLVIQTRFDFGFDKKSLFATLCISSYDIEDTFSEIDRSRK